MHCDTYEMELGSVEESESAATPPCPSLSITVSDCVDTLRERLTGATDDVLTEEAIDVAFRRRSVGKASESEGVLSLTNRTTGEYILELDTPETLIRDVVRGARRYAAGTDTNGQYTLRLQSDRERFSVWKKRTLLVYSQDGTLLRHRSLIPKGIEI